MRLSRRAAAIMGSALTVSALLLACGDDGDDGGTDPPLTGTVSGSVTAAGTGVPGTALSLSATGQSTRSATSSSSGAFSFAAVPAGSWTLGITPPSGFALAGGQSASVPVTVTGGQTSTVNVSLAAAQAADAGIRATVTADGSPRSAVTVRLYNAGAASASATRSTGTDGTASFLSIAPGGYDVEVVPPSGFQLAAGEQARKSVSATSGAVAPVSFGLTASGGGGNVQVINIVGLTFSPSTVTVPAGTTVRWEASEVMFHTITPDGHSAWTRGTVQNANDTFSATLNTPGTYAYFCEPHRGQGMTGTITVQ
ncbi:MAG TPA: plastocyanin/azurin family copper-binding protein [Longimicrobiales bacterium]|nr:plastocyanin/azurin family copper-binding protein [Longimicrobiales bacterium]